MKRIQNRNSKIQATCSDNSDEWKAPNIKKTISLFLFLLFGFGCSLLCFVLELAQPKWLDHFHKSKVTSKSKISKELQIVVNKLHHLQTAIRHFDTNEVDVDQIQQSLSMLKRIKTKYDNKDI